MPIDPSTIEAIKTVRTRTEFEQFTATFPEGTMDEIQAFVGAARHLADDIQRLHATTQPTTPEFLTLDEAHALLETINASTNPITNLPMDDWPGAPSTETTDLVTSVLAYRVLPVLSAFSAQMTEWLRTADADAEDVAHVIGELHRCLMDRPVGKGGRTQWAHWVSATTRALGGLVNRGRAAFHTGQTRGTELTAEQFRAATIDTFENWGLPTLRQAVTVLHALASKRMPDGATIEWWPLRATESQAVHVGQVLDRVLIVIGQHADALTRHGARVLTGTGATLPDFIADMQGRVAHMQVTAHGTDCAAATEFVQSGLHVLIGMLPRVDSPTLAELEAAQ